LTPQASGNQEQKRQEEKRTWRAGVGSAKGAARTAKRVRNRLAPHSVLRVFIERSAKGAARTAKRVRNWLAPHSVLRVFLKDERNDSEG
jgi:hypothetical protein